MSAPNYLPNVDAPRLGGLDALGLWHDSDGRFQTRGVTAAKAASVRHVPGRDVAQAAKARPDGARARLTPASPLRARLGDGIHTVTWHDDRHGKVVDSGRPVLVAWDQLEGRPGAPTVNEMAAPPLLRPHRDMEAEREAIYVEIGKLQAAGEERGGKKWRDNDQAGADAEEALFAKARALKEGWETNAGTLISTGVLTPAEVDEYSDDRHGIADRIASNLGGPSRDGWQPLPQRLYHVTTARDAVLDDGRLRTRTELALERGSGLGGGTSDAISFAADPKVANDIRDGILEAIDVSSGRTTVADLIERARTGDSGSEPFIDDFIGYWARSGWHDGDPLPLGVELAMPGGDNDDPDHRFDVLKIWLAYRELHKGPVDPLFFSVDAATLAATDPEQVAILEAFPKPGAMGIPLGGLLGEWRTPTGAAVDITLPLPPVVNEMAERPVAVRFDGMTPAEPGATHVHGVRWPPAWTDVHVADDPEGVNGMLARGYDAKGRQQYLYSAAHTERQAAQKFARVQAFVEHLPKLDADLAAAVTLDDTAAALALIRRTGMRPGGTGDTKAEKQAFGATTLLGSHVTLDGGAVRFQFTGKKGVDIDITVADPLVVAAITARADKVGTDEPLFATTAAKVNAYLDDHTAPEFKVKDLRTVRANAVAASLVAARPEPPSSERERKRWINEVGDAVAAQLGNTRTVALASYINPLVFGAWQPGETAADLEDGDVFSIGGIKIRKTADGYVDDATGAPLNADGTPR